MITTGKIDQIPFQNYGMLRHSARAVLDGNQNPSMKKLFTTGGVFLPATFESLSIAPSMTSRKSSKSQRSKHIPTFAKAHSNVAVKNPQSLTTTPSNAGSVTAEKVTNAPTQKEGGIRVDPDCMSAMSRESQTTCIARGGDKNGGETPAVTPTSATTPSSPTAKPTPKTDSSGKNGGQVVVGGGVGGGGEASGSRNGSTTGSTSGYDSGDHSGSLKEYNSELDVVSSSDEENRLRGEEIGGGHCQRCHKSYSIGTASNAGKRCLLPHPTNMVVAIRRDQTGTDFACLCCRSEFRLPKMAFYEAGVNSMLTGYCYRGEHTNDEDDIDFRYHGGAALTCEEAGCIEYFV